jgi:hypothetical protein
MYYSAPNLHEPVRALLVHGCAVIGRDVYSSNLQLGGPKIMHTNGVAHQVVNNDYDGTPSPHTPMWRLCLRPCLISFVVVG